MRATLKILLLLLITLTSVQSQDKINLKGFVLEVLDVDYIKLNGPKLKEYVKVELWEEKIYERFLKTKDKKYKHNFKQEGFCKYSSGLRVITTVKPGKHILIISFKENGKLDSYIKRFDTLK